MKIFTLFAFIAITACGSQKELAAVQASIYENKWLLRKVHSEGVSQQVDTKAFIKFDKEKGSAGGNGSCNSFGSNSTINDDQVSFTNIFSTKMYCEAVQKTEDLYLKQLARVTRFEIKDKELKLYQDKELLLEFIAETK